VAQMLRREFVLGAAAAAPPGQKGYAHSFLIPPFVAVAIANDRDLIMNLPAQDSHSTPETTPTVLVVEDEPAIREVVADLLQNEGYAVRQASDGLQAIDELEVDDVDLVLSDVRMPRLDGPSLAHRLRGHGHAVPVVLMSAVDCEVDLPGVRFLPKPFDPDHLLHVVGSALRANR
jgi:CheY-like chemotaxis protein